MDSNKTQLLLIEDDPAIAETVQIALTQQGHQIVWQSSGQAGIKVALNPKQPVDLVLLDVGLPDLNGFEVCRTIRLHSKVPILFLTAHADEIDRVQGFEVGGDDYLVKPFSLRELAARIRVILRRQSSATSDTKVEQAMLACGPLALDELTAAITLHAKTLPLTRTEYLLLAHLMRHPRQVFSREQLLDAVQGLGSPTGDRAIDTHIKTLRSKLGNIDPIMTHRGFGYSLNLAPQ